MFKNDRMMMILTGLVLAIFAGSMVKYGDRIMGLMSGANVVSSEDDSYSVRAGASQILDVLSNDEIKGQIVVLSNPNCGAVELTSSNKLSFSTTTACQGQVEFAYCVNSKDECAARTVRVNVISVAYAQNNGPDNTANTQTASANTNSAAPVNTQVQVVQDAPQIESFSVEMSPPMLASPTISEFVSPSVAVASIRQPSGGLTQSATVDQNIAAQNSASVAQTATTAPTVFGAPDMGESNDIMIGATGRAVASNTPTSLQPSTTNDSVVALAEHGPEALASLSASRIMPAMTESAPLSANPERTSFNPDTSLNTKTAAVAPDARFSASPNSAGPIALVALNPVSSGNTAGERLNVILTEPGLQSFATPLSAPTALEPAAPGPATVTVLEHAPRVSDAPVPPRAIGGESTASVFYTSAPTHSFPHSYGPAPTMASLGTETAIPANIGAAAPVQVAIASEVTRKDIMSPYIVLGRTVDPDAHSDALQRLASANATVSRPNIDLTPAGTFGGSAIQQASLNTPAESSIAVSPNQNSECSINLTTEATTGATIAVDIFAPCKPTQMLTVEHAGLAFSVLTDQQGAAHVVVPALEANADVSVLFTDGGQATASVQVPDIDNVVRVGLTWTNGMNLDLQANEFGSTAQVNAQSPRDYRSARLQGGGYLVQLGDPTLAGGKQAEVYTISVERQQRGTIALSVMLDNPSAVCGRSILAKTVRSRVGQSARMSSIRFTVPACGSLGSQMILPGAVNNIRLAGR